MRDFTNKKNRFIARIKENRKYVELKSRLGNNIDLGNPMLVTDSEVQLYTNITTPNKSGKTNNRYEPVEQRFQLIVVKSKGQPDAQYRFVNNDFKLIITKKVGYRSLLSLYHAGTPPDICCCSITTVCVWFIYMTLIVAMLALIYKKENEIGYKTVKRRFRMEIRDMITALIVIQCGGSLNLFFTTKNE